MKKETVLLAIVNVFFSLLESMLPISKNDKKVDTGKSKKPRKYAELGVDADGNAVMKGDMSDVT